MRRGVRITLDSVGRSGGARRLGGLGVIKASHRPSLRQGSGMWGMDRRSLIERAYELAKSGEFENVDALGRRLKSEGYIDVVAHIGSHTSLRRELKQLCRQSRTERTSQTADQGRTSERSSCG